MPDKQQFVATATVTANVDVRDVWAVWEDVNAWANWDQGLDRTEYRGTFRPGTRYTLVPHGGEAVEAMLKTVTPGAEFSDEVILPFGVLRRFHRVEKLGPRVKISHELQAEIEERAATFFAKEIWPHMQIGLPVSLNNIVGLIEPR
jgi:hypothetical protein